MIGDVPLIIRADANWEIGTGHIMRCLALAQAWQDHGGKAVFITQCDSPALKLRLFDEGCQVVDLHNRYPAIKDLEQTISVLDSHPGAWLALDGYHFDSEYQRHIKKSGHPLLVIDDMADLDHYYADIILNQNIYAEQLNYNCEPYTKLLLGTRYVLLRREFLKWRGYKREIPEVAKKILVTMGGSDPDNVTLKVLKALDQVGITDLDIVVVVGPSNPNKNVLLQAIEFSLLSVRLTDNVSNMPDLMAWADMAVITAGSTLWELMYMGNTILSYARNLEQNNILVKLDRMNIIKYCGYVGYAGFASFNTVLRELALSKCIRTNMYYSGMNIIDGCGNIRLLKSLGSIGSNNH